MMRMLREGPFRNNGCELDQGCSFFHLKTVFVNAVKHFPRVPKIFSWLANWEMLCSGVFQAS